MVRSSLIRKYNQSINRKTELINFHYYSSHVVAIGVQENEILEDSNDSANEVPTISTNQATYNSTNETNDSTLEVPTTSTNQATSINLNNTQISIITLNQENFQKKLDSFQFSFNGLNYYSVLQDVFFTF